jgi:hypothetical protein
MEAMGRGEGKVRVSQNSIGKAFYTNVVHPV